MKLIPHGTAMVVKPFKERRTTDSGIQLPDSVKGMDMILFAEVLQTGKGWYSVEKQCFTPLPNVPGDIVAMPSDVKCRPLKFSAVVAAGGNTVNFPDELLVDISSVMGTVEFENGNERDEFLRLRSDNVMLASVKDILGKVG